MLKSSRILAAAGAVAGLGLAVAPLNVFATDGVVSDQHTDQLVLTVLPSCTFGNVSKGTTPYPSGIEHDASTGTYDSYANSTNPENISATHWDRAETTAGTPGATDSQDSGNHNTGVLESTGYGVRVGESGTTSSNQNASLHTVHRTMQAGTSTDTFASTKLWVVCNNGGGYSITAEAVALDNDTANADGVTIPVSATYSATVSGYNLKSVTSTATDAGEATAGTAMTVPAATVAPTSETIIASHAAVSHESGDSLDIVYGLGVATSQKADTYAGTVTYKLYKGINGVNGMVIPPAGA